MADGNESRQRSGIDWNLHGTSIVITGAASGIGAAAATMCAESGANVVLADTRPDALDEAVTELGARGLTVVGVVADVGTEEGCSRSVMTAVEHFGSVDVVVNNAAAGTQYVGGTVESIEPDVWQLAQDVNLKAAYFTSRTAIPFMRAKGNGGSIVNVSSSSALRTDARRPTHAYAASKGGLISLSAAMAVSYGPERIRVNTVIPGLTRTRLTSDIIDSSMEMIRAGGSIPLQRAGEPEEVAAAITFLASSASSFITGASILVDGGASGVSVYGRGGA